MNTHLQLMKDDFMNASAMAGSKSTIRSCFSASLAFLASTLNLAQELKSSYWTEKTTEMAKDLEMRGSSRGSGKYGTTYGML